MHPEIARLGVLHFKFYGLALSVSFVVGTYLAMSRAKKARISEDLIVWVALVVLFLAVAGSRALYVLTHLDEFRGDSVGIFMIWTGGLSMYGGLLAAIVGGIAFIKLRGDPVWRVTDVVAPSIALGEAITRIGCFMNGCCFGTPTRLPWGVVFPPDSFSATVFRDIPIHPSQIYSSILALLIFLFLLWFDRRKRFEGQLFWMCLLLLAAARGLVDFTRYYGRSDCIGQAGGLTFTDNQLIVAGIIVLSIVMMRILRRKTG